MRLKKLSSLFIVSLLLAAVLPISAFAKKDTDNFYFDSFEADYYLTKKADGTSGMKVKEKLVAVFPTYNQNKGICRDIPYTNQDGMNRTMDKPSASSLNLKRNGFSEPVYSIERESDYYEICTGDETYVTGKQVYTFEYEFYNVITRIDENKKVIMDSSGSEAYQELYWDTNGTGWKQKFNSVTARVHFSDEATKKAYDGEEWCYVGKYGASNQSRCKITKTDDGIELKADNLKAYENLTFDIQFKRGSFVVPEPPVTYVPLIIIIVSVTLCALIIIRGIIKFIKNGDKRLYYKGLFVAPEYAGPKEYSIAEMSEIYIGKKKNVNVAILLRLITNKKINLIKKESGGFGGDKWSIEVLDLDGVEDEEKITLKLLNGGKEIAVGDKIDIKRRTATSSTISLGKKFDSTVKSKLINHKLVESDYKVGHNNTGGSITVAIIFLFIWGVWVLPFLIAAFTFSELVFAGVRGPGKDCCFFVVLVSVIITIAIRILLSSRNSKYKKHTNLGLEKSRCMDGLKLYIKMAEADRIEFLQSVKNVDVSDNGIVKLYEKLLPYAAIFGLEKTWMKELQKYYAMNDVTEPDWYSADFYSLAILSTISSAGSYAGRASMSAGSGSSSSGFSGGGGGGFSGGGGGGGGGGGR